MSMLKLYQEFQPTTELPVVKGDIAYSIMGLFGELGEVMELLKKKQRDNKEVSKDTLEKECGDVEWYWTKLLNDLGLDRETILIKNRDKLIDRKNRNMIKGDGSSR